MVSQSNNLAYWRFASCSRWRKRTTAPSLLTKPFAVNKKIMKWTGCHFFVESYSILWSKINGKVEVFNFLDKTVRLLQFFLTHYHHFQLFSFFGKTITTRRYNNYDRILLNEVKFGKIVLHYPAKGGRILNYTSCRHFIIWVIKHSKNIENFCIAWYW